jgi:Flp pilus assembly protein TadG
MKDIGLRRTTMRLLCPGALRARASSGAGYGGRRSRLANERGQALLETAMTLPLVLFVAVGIFEFGRAYQTYQVLTNAAREGARVAVLPSGSLETVQSRVVGYLQSGELANASSATVNLNRNATVSVGTGTASASIVTVSYPFSFMVLNPVANLVTGSSSLGAAPFAMTVVAEMRNEAQ